MKKVLIAGGSRGIGAAAVRRFAADGCEVAFLYKSSGEAARKLSRETGAAAICADVSSADEVRKAFESIRCLDVLVCCAGVAKIAQICDTDDKDLQSLVGTNLTGTFYLCREASKLMVREHSGRIITVGSVWGRYGASCESAYSATKAGVRGLTMALAKELAPSGISVNCVDPGVIDTDMNACLSDEVRRELASEIPAMRFGKAEEVADLIAYLASDQASYITGQCIGIDGGFS